MYVRGGLSGLSGIVQDLAGAIARMENTNAAYANPCALTAGPGATGKAPNGIAIFPDFGTGEAACERQISLNIGRGDTIDSMMQRWAPVGCGPMCQGNDPAAYARNVSAWTGLPTDVPLSQLDAGGATLSLDFSGSADAIDNSGLLWIAGGVLAFFLIREVMG